MTKYSLVFLTITAQLLLSCVPAVPPPAKTSFKPLPLFEIDLSTLDFMTKLFVCDTPDSKMPVADFNEASTMTVDAKITVQKVETTDCDGKVAESLRDVELFSPAIDINSEEDLSPKLNYLVVENSRTCSSQKITALEEDQFTKVKKGNLQKDALSSGRASTASVSGEAQLILTDSFLKLLLRFK